MSSYYWATGKRKTAVARVRLREGEGRIIINRRELESYIPFPRKRAEIVEPFQLTGTGGKFDTFANIKGGGLSAQADALKLGIARALVKVDEGFKGVLKEKGLLTRDPREKERKKYGQRGARAKFQFSKR
jgi:small subunit ribosomal protein S9